MIRQQTLAQIAAKIEETGVDESVITRLRADYPKLHFTYCSDDDILDHEPVLARDAFNLYLIDGRDHCLCLTHDFESATGVVVAEIYPE